MKLLIELESPEEYNTPITFAKTLIDARITKNIIDEEDVLRAQQKWLAEVAQHIQVYLRYNRV